MQRDAGQGAPEGEQSPDVNLEAKVAEHQMKLDMAKQKAELDMELKQAKFDQEQAMRDAKNAMDLRTS